MNTNPHYAGPPNAFWQATLKMYRAYRVKDDDRMTILASIPYCTVYIMHKRQQNDYTQVYLQKRRNT